MHHWPTLTFQKKLSPNDKNVTYNVSQFKPEKGKYGVCTSLGVWAFLILKPMLKHAYNADEESERLWNRTSNMRSKNFISNIDFTKDGGREPEMSPAASLNINANRFNNMPKRMVALNFSN